MGLFDNDAGSGGFAFDLNNPTMMALLGALGGLGEASAPSRLPVTGGQAWGSAAKGLLSGALQGQQGQGLEFLNELRRAQAQEAGGRVKALNQFDPNSIFSGAAPMTPQGPAPVLPGQIKSSAGSVASGKVSARGGQLAQLINTFAGQFGIPSALAHTTADIESSYGQNVLNKISPSNTGVFQMARADQPGGAMDTLENQTSLGVKSLATTRQGLTERLGREPTNAEVYLAHQQGVTGAAALLANPDQPAGMVVPPVNISNNGGNPKASAAEFVKLWQDKYAQREGRFAQAPSSTAADASGGSAPPLVVPPGAGAVNIDPMALAKQRAIATMAGLPGDPLQGYAQAYYNSPQYLAAAEAAKKGATLPLDIQAAGPLAAGKAAGERSVTEASDIRIAQEKERIAREQAVIREQQILDEKIRRQFPGGAPEGTAAAEQTVKELSDIRANQAKEGSRQVRQPDGSYRLEKIPGSSQAVAEQQKEAAKGISGGVVTQDIDRALGLSGMWTTGMVGSKLRQLPGTPAFDLAELLGTLKANIGFERLQQMRETSPTGGALGPVSDTENKLLQSTLGSVEQAQSREQFEQNLRRLRETYQDVIHGDPKRLDKLLSEGRISQEQRDRSAAERVGSPSTPTTPPPMPTGATRQEYHNGKWYYQLGGKVYPHQ